VFAEKIRANIASLKIEHIKIVAASMGLICIHANDIHNRDGINAEADKFLYPAIPRTHDNREVALDRYHSGIGKRDKGLCFRYFGVALPKGDTKRVPNWLQRWSDEQSLL
jgi:hypothetical protein